jgi:DNA-binding transcriptional LysR family regulator
MNFSQLQSFVTLADTGSFTEAAYVTHPTQSAVSHALAALEHE